jgi:hypothetical protein
MNESTEPTIYSEPVTNEELEMRNQIEFIEIHNCCQH